LNPRLLAIAGPLKDSILAIPPGEVAIGRDSGNQLSISDPSLSRRHCVLKQDENVYRIRDLDSRNGTFVNGVAVKDSRVQHGDQISVGDSVFILLLFEEDEVPERSRIEYDERATHTTAEFRPEDALYLHPDQILRELPVTSRLRRNLNALLKISRMVHAVRDPEQLQAQILDLIFEAVPAESGAILLGVTDMQFTSAFARQRGARAGAAMLVSRTITRHVLEKGVSILGSDVPGNQGLSNVESLVASQIRSLLCVPLTVYEKVVGCVYLQTTNPDLRFDEDHLQLVTAIAGISAVALENARRLQWLEEENLRLANEISLEHNMVGESPSMKEFYRLLSRVAPTDSTVVIEGESGTGKELAACAIHRNSPRSQKPFVAINCAAIPEGLLESELFGHEKGSFTGAVMQKKGRLESADGGVVFLDEIGELAPALQVKLLRVLQEREFERVGGTRPVSVDLRLIAATNKNLWDAVQRGEFRQDLYYRLNVVTLVMPPLRDRREDIPLLAEYFVGKYSKKFTVRARRISRNAMAYLVNYDWPGNVRELENAIQRALVLCTNDVIQPEDLPESLLEKNLPSEVAVAKYHVAIKDLKRQLIAKAVEEAKGNYTEAARLLGVHANYLHRLIRNLDLRDSLRSASAVNAPKTSAIFPRA